MSSSGEAGKTSGTGSDASGCACASIALAAETRAFALAEIAPTPCNLSHFQLRVDIQTSQKSGQRRAGTKKRIRMFSIPSIRIVGFQLLGRE